MSAKTLERGIRTGVRADEIVVEIWAQQRGENWFAVPRPEARGSAQAEMINKEIKRLWRDRSFRKQTCAYIEWNWMLVYLSCACVVLSILALAVGQLGGIGGVIFSMWTFLQGTKRPVCPTTAVCTLLAAEASIPGFSLLAPVSYNNVAHSLTHEPGIVILRRKY